MSSTSINLSKETFFTVNYTDGSARIGRLTSPQKDYVRLTNEELVNMAEFLVNHEVLDDIKPTEEILILTQDGGDNAPNLFVGAFKSPKSLGNYCLELSKVDSLYAKELRILAKKCETLSEDEDYNNFPFPFSVDLIELK